MAWCTVDLSMLSADVAPFSLLLPLPIPFPKLAPDWRGDDSDGAPPAEPDSSSDPSSR